MPRRRLKMTKAAIASRRAYRRRKKRGGALFGDSHRLTARGRHLVARRMHQSRPSYRYKVKGPKAAADAKRKRVKKNK